MIEHSWFVLFSHPHSHRNEIFKSTESYVDADGRENVNRLLVRAAVPIFMTPKITPKKARSFTIKALAAALRQGYFLRIAEAEGA